MLVLAIDTSTPVVTAGLVELKLPHELAAAAGDATSQPSAPFTTVAERTVTDAFGHAEHLMPLVTAVVAAAGHAVGDIDAVVVGVGPGPYTGLRVGMVTAAALGDALDVPAHGVPSHDAVARLAGLRDDFSPGDFLVVTDARRREVYLSAYSAAGVRAHGPVVLAPADVPDLLATEQLAPQWITGAGAPLLPESIGLPIHQSVWPWAASSSGSLSSSLVACAARALLTGVVPGPLAPLYLRRPDATAPTAPKPVLPVDDSTAVSQGQQV